VSTVKRLDVLRDVARTVAAAWPPRGGGSRSGRSYAVTLLTPVRPEAARDLAAHLRGLARGADSPLAKLPYVHFARWLVIEQLKTDWPGAPVPPPRLQSPYLLFTVSLTAPDEEHVRAREDQYVERLPESFLHELRARIPAEVDAIWGHCFGYPGTGDAEAFVRYLAQSQIETALFHVGYPDVTVDEVRRALRLREQFIDFARDHQDERDPSRLQQAYLQESPTWLHSS
jgi:hypothetical protein